MPIILYEKAKQAVAEKHGYLPFYLATKVMGEDIHYTEAADVYSQWVANEAVKADRKQILKECVEDMFLKEPNWDSADFFPVIDKSKARNLPLPFPQQPDGI